MTFMKNVKYCEAEPGEMIQNFAKELVDYRKSTKCDIIAKFNDVYIEVKSTTTEKDIIDNYHNKL